MPSVTISQQEKKPFKLMDLRKPPSKHKQYMMGEILGEGAQGKVREAIDSETLQRVAIKRINLRQLRKIRHAEENLRKEITIHSKLKHKHVIEMLDSFVNDEKQKVYIVYEHVAGGSLQDVADSLPDNVLPATLMRRCTYQLFDALAYCHSCGVVHRDIKPSNLLISIEGVLKVGDFGVAEELDRYDEHDTCSKSRGSPAFQSPEVAAGKESFSGFKVDVWAAGVSLFLLMSGQVPFEGSSIVHLFELIELGKYDIPERIAADAKLRDLICGLLVVDETTRLSVQDARKHTWLDGAEDEGWSDEDRRLVSAVVLGSVRPLVVMRSVARMYGEEPPLEEALEEPPTPAMPLLDDSAPVAVPPLREPKGDALTAEGGGEENKSPALGRRALRRMLTGEFPGGAKSMDALSQQLAEAPEPEDAEGESFRRKPRRTRSADAECNGRTRSADAECSVQ